MWRLRGLEPRAKPLTEEELHALVHPDDLLQMKREYDLAAREQRPASGQFRVRWPDGSWRWLASRSVPVFDAEGARDAPHRRQLGRDRRRARPTRRARSACSRSARAAPSRSSSRA